MRDLERTSETRKYFCYARFGRARRIYERDRRTTRLLDAGQGVQQQYRLLSSQRESTSLTGAIVHTGLEVSNRESGRGVRCGSLGSWAFQDRSVVHFGLGDGSPDQRPAGIERSLVKRSTNGTNAKAACLQACANISASGGTQALGTAAFLEVAADARSRRAARVPTGCCS